VGCSSSIQTHEQHSHIGSSSSTSVALTQASSSLVAASCLPTGSSDLSSIRDSPSFNIPIKCLCSPSLPPPHLAFKRKLDSDNSEIKFVYPHPVGPKLTGSQLKKKKAPCSRSLSAPIVLSSNSDDDFPIKREAKCQKTMKSTKIPVTKLMSIDEVIELSKFLTSFDIPAHSTCTYSFMITDDNWRRWQEAYPDKELTMQLLMKHEVIYTSLIDSALVTVNLLGSRFVGWR
jgi:hypothetical protein